MKVIGVLFVTVLSILLRIPDGQRPLLSTPAVGINPAATQNPYNIMLRKMDAAGMMDLSQLFPFMYRGKIDPDNVVASGIYQTEGYSGLPDVDQPYGILIAFWYNSDKYVHLWFCPNAVNVGVWWRACFGPSKTSWAKL